MRSSRTCCRAWGSPAHSHVAGRKPEVLLGSGDLGKYRARVTLVLFRRRALGEQSGAEQKVGARVRKSRQKELLARRTRALCKLNGAKERC
jgi:hypothetical protein